MSVGLFGEKMKNIEMLKAEMITTEMIIPQRVFRVLFVIFINILSHSSKLLQCPRHYNNRSSNPNI